MEAKNMAKYVIETSHTPDECLKALDEMLAKNPEILDKFVWGCAQGVHTGWAYIDAKNKEDATALLPKSAQTKAKITEVGKFTPEQIKSFHKK